MKLTLDFSRKDSFLARDTFFSFYKNQSGFSLKIWPFCIGYYADKLFIWGGRKTRSIYFTVCFSKHYPEIKLLIESGSYT